VRRAANRRHRSWGLAAQALCLAASGFALARTASAQDTAPSAPEAAPPFVLPVDGVARDRAVACLTAAIYYEAGREPRDGQEAVAQVVLNRVRHPGFPKSVCGVIYEGAERATGCQFSFTCDGSTRRRPLPARWRAAEAVAMAALDGHVAAEVGASTHYHALSVRPAWRTTLVQTARIGAHVCAHGGERNGRVGAPSARRPARAGRGAVPGLGPARRRRLAPAPRDRRQPRPRILSGAGSSEPGPPALRLD
jgi:hypothetical protein